MIRNVTAVLVAVALALTAFPARAAEDFKLVDGDRIVWIGSTFIEQEQKYGYWETRLTCDHPQQNITFRNLGWSGDTVWGESRAVFDTPVQGYQRLVAQTLSLKPTVLFIGYGTNESFAGEAGLPGFREQLNKLLDDLAPSKARVVLLAPPLVEEANWRAGNLEERRRQLQRYAEAIQQIAQERRAWFVKDVGKKYGPASPLTDDGMHFTAYGYWFTAANLVSELRIQVPGLKVIELDGGTPGEVVQEILPAPPVPGGSHKGNLATDGGVLARGLKPGKYTLQIDGQAVLTADAETWMHPPKFGRVLVLHGPSLDQAEKLRQAIVEKNRLYFYRWRPENETYLFGFRKHEQGRNAVEIPKFDPLIAGLEADIARLRVPVAHRYQLIGEK